MAMIAWTGDVRECYHGAWCPKCGHQLRPYAHGTVKHVKQKPSLLEKLINVANADGARKDYRTRMNEEARVKEWRNASEPLVCRQRRKNRRVKRASAKG